VPVEVLSNQASKQLWTINNDLKMQRILFHKIHDIKNKLLIIIHVDKNEEFNWKIDKFLDLIGLGLI
jgi:beta-xylosidase